MPHHRYHSRHHRRHYSHRKQYGHYSLFQRITYFARKHPISVGVILVIASMILFRLSFINAFLSSSEVFIWSMIVSILLFLSGLLTLIGWWRNHILQHGIGVKIGKWK